MNPMMVEIWSDSVCPWCYIGKRRFESALERFEHRDQVEVVWRSFELDPHAPRQFAGTLNEMLAQKMGRSVAQAASLNAQVTELAAAEGLDYRLEQARPGNTFDAHRLVHLAAEHGLRSAVKERLMRAYFTEGLPIGDADALVTIGADAGIPAEKVREMLAGNAYADAVRADEDRAAGFGIRGVPFFAIDAKYGVSGAQSPAALLDALERAWADRHSTADSPK